MTLRPTVTRLGALAAVSALIFSACSSGATPSPAASSGPSPSPGASASPGGSSGPSNLSGNVEIFSYWTAGGEAQALAALEKVFSQQYPNIKVTNAVIAGGAGANANAVLATRMTGGNPPDTFSGPMRVAQPVLVSSPRIAGHLAGRRGQPTAPEGLACPATGGCRTQVDRRLDGHRPSLARCPGIRDDSRPGRSFP